MDYVAIRFPRELYNLIVLRSDGRLDPATLAVEQIEQFIERTRDEPLVWSEKGVAKFAAEAAAARADVGDPTRGHQWGPVFMPNGTELRMKYKGEFHYSTVEHERIIGDGKARFFSVSGWVRAVADHTSRNAWHDVWIRFPGEGEYKYSDLVRDAVLEKK